MYLLAALCWFGTCWHVCHLCIRVLLVELCVIVCTCWLVCHGVYLLACVSWCVLGLCVMVLVCVMVCTWVVCHGVGLCHGVYLDCVMVFARVMLCVSWYVLVGLLDDIRSPHLGQGFYGPCPTSGGFRNVLPPTPSLGSTVEATESLQQNLDPRSSRGLYHSNTALS